jgi:RNA polymerase sigma-70 factor (ECF subfamily)
METPQNTPVLSLDALRSGDRQELGRLIDQYSPLIYRLLLSMLRDPSAAEDALQETFIKAMRALPEFEGRSSLSTWLYRIASNEALMMLRKKHPEVISLEQGGQDEEGEAEPIQIVDWCCLPESELMSSEARQQIDAAIGQLPESLRLVFLLRDVEGLSIRETAQVLNLSEQNVKTRLLRARLRLRELLSGYYSERMAMRRENE